MLPPVITFFGNCQAGVLAEFYQRFGLDREADVRHVQAIALADGSPGRAAAVERLRCTTILVEQISDWQSGVDEHISTGCARIAFPNASHWFIWPYSGRQHPRIETPGTGPYPPEFGDSFLNRLIMAQVPTAAAVRRYVNLDIVARASIASRYEKEMELLDHRDRTTRIGLRDTIDSYFRIERLFRTRGHPNMRIFTLLATSVFHRMGADPQIVQAALRGQYRPPLPPTEMPIHPKLAEYFGIAHAGPTARYWYFPDGFYTFAEYAERYMNFTYNKSARTLLDRPELPAERRLALADEALSVSPNSAFVLERRAHALLALGRIEEALTAARAACDPDPTEPGPWYNFASMLLQIGMPEAAGKAARHALARHPYHADAHLLIGRLALQAGRSAEALQHFQIASVSNPQNSVAATLYAEASRDTAGAAAAAGNDLAWRQQPDAESW